MNIHFYELFDLYPAKPVLASILQARQIISSPLARRIEEGEAVPAPIAIALANDEVSLLEIWDATNSFDTVVWLVRHIPRVNLVSTRLALLARLENTPHTKIEQQLTTLVRVCLTENTVEASLTLASLASGLRVSHYSKDLAKICSL